MTLNIDPSIILQGLIVLGVAGIAKLQLSTAVALGQLSQRQADHEKSDDKVHDRVTALERRELNDHKVADDQVEKRVTALERGAQ